MNGPEHYAMAEALLRQVDTDKPPKDEAMFMVTAAQVHATLALAAKTAEPGDIGTMLSPDKQAACICPPARGVLGPVIMPSRDCPMHRYLFRSD